jgi:hypothetical protein
LLNIERASLLENGYAVMDEKPKKKPWKEMTYAEKKARSAFVKAERAARKLEAETRWKELVAPHARFLEVEYGFHFTSVEYPAWDLITAKYQSAILQVAFEQWIDSDSVDISLTRLVDGALPQRTLSNDQVYVFNSTHMWLVLQKRAPDESAKLSAIRGLDHDSLGRGLAANSAALRAYCDDILRGNFTFFDDMTTEFRRQFRERDLERQRIRQQGQER